MSTESERKQILFMVESGKITPSQGVKLLQALDDTASEGELGGESLVQAAQEAPIFEPPVDQNRVVAENLNPSPTGQPQDHPTGIPVEPGENPDPQPTQEANLPPRPVDAPDYKSWRRWMMIPLWTGVVVTILGGVLDVHHLDGFKRSQFLVCLRLDTVLSRHRIDRPGLGRPFGALAAYPHPAKNRRMASENSLQPSITAEVIGVACAYIWRPHS